MYTNEPIVYAACLWVAGTLVALALVGDGNAAVRERVMYSAGIECAGLLSPVP